MQHIERTRLVGARAWRAHRDAWVLAAPRWRKARATLATLAVATTLAACGPSPDDFPPDDHVDVQIASTAAGGGALAADYDVDEPIEVHASASVGGFELYSASDPGFAPLEHDEPDHGLYVLEDGVSVSFEVTALDEGVRVKFGSVTLDEVGDAVLLGTTPDVHTHGEWQVVVPEGVHEGAYALSFRLTTDSQHYGASAPVTVVLTLADEEPHA